jgi:transglutaminase-like putative cysteine protease
MVQGKRGWFLMRNRKDNQTEGIFEIGEGKMEELAINAKKRIKRSWIRNTAICAIFFILAALIPIAGGCSSKTDKPNPPENTPSTASLHEQRIGDLKSMLAQAPSLSPQEIRDGLTQANVDLSDLNSKLEEEFQKTTDILTNLNLPDKQKIHENVVSKYEDGKNRLNQAIEETITSGDPDIQARTANLSSLLGELSPEEEAQQPLGTELPSKMIERDPVPPVLGANIAPAYLYGTPNLTPSTLPPVDPTPEDLAPTLDAQQRDDIIAKAAELNNDPIKIYEWVRNNIDFEPYYGSKKGASETLAQMAGNDMDTASLLISLYRVSQIPARYVTGVIEITAEQAMKWTCVETPEAAQKLFASGGVPIQGVIEGGKLSKFRLTHTYTEAYLSYTNYRGAEAGEGPKKWVALDGSYKEYELAKSPASQIAFTGSVEAFVEELQQSGCINEAEGTLNSLPTEQWQNYIADYQARVNDFVEQQGSDHSWQELFLDQMNIVESLPGILSPVLPYQVLQAQSEYYEIPSQDRYRIRLGISRSSDNQPLLSHILETAAMDPDGYSIYFKAASEGDISIVNSYDSLEHVPAYLVQMAPVLTDSAGNPLEEQTQDTLGMGQECRLDVSVEIPGMQPSEQSDVIIAGTPMSLTFSNGIKTRDTMVSWHDKIAALVTQLESAQANQSGTIDPRNLLHLLLASVGDSYLYQSQAADAWAGNAANIRVIQDISYARSFLGLSVQQVLGTTTSVDLGGQGLDVDRDSQICVSRKDSNSFRAFCMITGMLKSGLEAKVFQQLLGQPGGQSVELESVSTTGLHDYSLKNNQQIVYLGPGHENNLNKISCSPQIKSQLSDYINQGMEIFIPTSEYDLPYWKGWAYSINDPKTGSGAYIIQGGTAGGEVDLQQAELIGGSWVYSLAETIFCAITEAEVSEVWLMPAFAMIGYSYELGIIQLASLAPSGADYYTAAVLLTAITGVIIATTLVLGATIVGTMCAALIGLVASAALLMLPAMLSAYVWENGT